MRYLLLKNLYIKVESELGKLEISIEHVLMALLIIILAQIDDLFGLAV